MFGLTVDVHQILGYLAEDIKGHGSTINPTYAAALPYLPGDDEEAILIGLEAIFLQDGANDFGQAFIKDENAFDKSAACARPYHFTAGSPPQQGANGIYNNGLPSPRLSGEDVKALSELNSQFVNDGEIPDGNLAQHLPAYRSLKIITAKWTFQF